MREGWACMGDAAKPRKWGVHKWFVIPLPIAVGKIAVISFWKARWSNRN